MRLLFVQRSGLDEEGDRRVRPRRALERLSDQRVRSDLVDLKGRLSNPPQRRLSPTDLDDLLEAYKAGATINQLAVEFGIHRTTVAGHLDRHGVPRHSELTVWDDDILREAAEMYATGLSLTDVAHQFGIDAHTVASRFRRAGVAVRPRRGWTSRVRSGQERR